MHRCINRYTGSKFATPTIWKPFLASQPVTITTKSIPRNLPFILAAGILSVSASAIFVRYAQGESVPSLLIAAGRLVIAALIVTPLVLQRYLADIRSLGMKDLMLAGVAGVFLALHFVAWVTSLEYTSVMISVVIVTTMPIWVAILEGIFLRVKPPRQVMIGLMVAIGGGLLIGVGGRSPAADAAQVNSELIGGLLSLIGAITVAAYLVIGRKLRATLPIIPYIWLVYGCGGIILSIAVLLTGTPVLGYTPFAYLLLLAMAVFPQLIGHSSLNYAVGYLPATFVSLLTQLEPLGSAVLAVILFAEIPQPIQIVGSLIILCGVIITTLARNPSSKQ